jgi:hypothetical protein
MSLAEKLKEISDGSKESIPEKTRSLMKKATDELRNSGIMDTAFRAGDILPPFELPNSNGRMVSSREFLEKGNLVVTFYRGVW